MFQIGFKCAHSGEALRDHVACWSAGVRQSGEHPSPNLSPYQSRLSRSTAVCAARSPPERKWPELDGAIRQPLFVTIRSFDSEPDELAALFRSHRERAIARILACLFIFPSDGQT